MHCSTVFVLQLNMYLPSMHDAIGAFHIWLFIRLITCVKMVSECVLSIL